MLYLLFRFCCGIITVISMLTGFTYEEVNTFLFIYVEPLILMATALYIPIKGRKYLRKPINKAIFGLSIVCNRSLLCYFTIPQKSSI
ncbi:MAG: hypothetical protein K5893_00195 [Prevotella sp.]|nr:hypothetical protein [Prevotella sp.]